MFSVKQYEFPHSNNLFSHTVVNFTFNSIKTIKTDMFNGWRRQDVNRFSANTLKWVKVKKKKKKPYAIIIKTKILFFLCHCLVNVILKEVKVLKPQKSENEPHVNFNEVCSVLSLFALPSYTQHVTHSRHELTTLNRAVGMFSITNHLND